MLKTKRCHKFSFFYVLKVGLTGGIGCGKSTVVQFFAAAGWSTLQADAIARGILTENNVVQAALRERWGEAVFQSDGAIDRKMIAKRVFGNATELAWLEALLHPLVRNVWKTAILEASQLNWLVEIPLLFEKKLELNFDFVVCVISPSKVVEDRMFHRGYTVDEIRQRRRHQMPLEEKVRCSDYVISNAGNIDFLERQTQRLIRQIQTQV